MTQYLAQSEYNNMGGDSTMKPFDYNRREYRAQKAIDRHTFGRVQGDKPQREAVKMLVFELVTLYTTNETLRSQESAGSVASWSNDGVALSVKQAASLTTTELDAQVGELIADFLADEVDGTGTPLLYRGRTPTCP